MEKSYKKLKNSKLHNKIKSHKFIFINLKAIYKILFMIIYSSI